MSRNKINVGNIQIYSCVSCGKPCDEDKGVCQECYNLEKFNVTYSINRPIYLQEIDENIQPKVGCAISIVVGLIFFISGALTAWGFYSLITLLQITQ